MESTHVELEADDGEDDDSEEHQQQHLQQRGHRPQNGLEHHLQTCITGKPQHRHHQGLQQHNPRASPQTPYDLQQLCCFIVKTLLKYHPDEICDNRSQRKVDLSPEEVTLPTWTSEVNTTT